MIRMDANKSVSTHQVHSHATVTKDIDSISTNGLAMVGVSEYYSAPESLSFPRFNLVLIHSFLCCWDLFRLFGISQS